MKLYFLKDKKSNGEFHPMFSTNKDVALRNLALELRSMREKNDFYSEEFWKDSSLYELDMDSLKINLIEDFRGFFANEDKNLKK